MEVLFFFQAEDGIRDIGVTGVQTCALPIWRASAQGERARVGQRHPLLPARRDGVAALAARSPALADRLLLPAALAARGGRSEERRVGKEGRSRWSPYP